MNKKGYGTTGELAVAKTLSEKGYNVFKELGDNSRIDLIAEKEGYLIKIQVKSTKSKKGAVSVDFQKHGPNGYNYVYLSNEVDLFAVYVSDVDLVMFVPFSFSSQRTHYFRIEDPLKKSSRNKFAKDFLDISDETGERYP